MSLGPNRAIASLETGPFSCSQRRLVAPSYRAGGKPEPAHYGSRRGSDERRPRSEAQRNVCLTQICQFQGTNGTRVRFGVAGVKVRPADVREMKRQPDSTQWDVN
jgi:hypothetical protein